MLINYCVSYQFDSISFKVPFECQDVLNLSKLLGIYCLDGIHGIDGSFLFVGETEEMRHFMKNLEAMGYSFIHSEVYGWKS